MGYKMTFTVHTDWGHLDWEMRGHNLAEITNIVVKPQHRRKGHGSQLMQMAMVDMLSYKVRYVYLFTQAVNNAAHEFYTALEFSLISYVKCFYGSQDDGVLYGQEL